MSGSPRANPPTRHAGHDVDAELRTAGLASTVQRRMVLGVLEGRQRPASAIDIYAHLHRDGHPVGLTTVYRTLHALAEAGLVHVFHRDGEDTYRHCRYGPHHLICQACGLVIEHSTAEITRLLQQIQAEADFRPNPQQADMLGVCGTCHLSGTDNTAQHDNERKPTR